MQQYSNNIESNQWYNRATSIIHRYRTNLGRIIAYKYVNIMNNITRRRNAEVMNEIDSLMYINNNSISRERDVVSCLEALHAIEQILTQLQQPTTTTPYDAPTSEAIPGALNSMHDVFSTLRGTIERQLCNIA